jgi:lysophospholipase L1-like esterase
MSLGLRTFRIGGWTTVALAAVLVAGSAAASTITQNTSWTIDRAGTTTKYRVTAYGDSIYAGYYGSLSRVAKRAAPGVDGEYLQKLWNSDIEVVRRTKSGAVAKDIYDNKIVAERSYMQSTNTRVVTFEMCGNDFLQARSNFKGQSGTCSFSGINTAMTNCTTYQERAMQYINANASANTKLKVISNIYYPGYDADNVQSSCTVNGSTVNMRDMFLPYLAQSNWRACNFAQQYGFQCADSFAQYMAADYDTNGDGQVDSAAIAYQPGESESSYVNRITVTLKSTLRDANSKRLTASTTADYILSDNTHPTYQGSTVYVGLFGGTGSTTTAPDYTDAQIVGGKNPAWNLLGHERMGWALSVFNPLAP